jgi:DNA-binding GntR family transcriptional regulator
MTDTTVEEIFGLKAGIVWIALNQNGPSTITDLVKATSLSREDIFGALGWLSREGKISVEMRGKARVFSLRPAL